MEQISGTSHTGAAGGATVAESDDERELSEVQSDLVPNEVRKWLETTFTRNSISQKRDKSDDKFKFRSVANAIRAGIVVDKIYRRLSATSAPFVSAEVASSLRTIDDWSFDCFNVNSLSNNTVLRCVATELFQRYGLLYKFKIASTTLKNFLTQIELGYTKHKNPYHNNLHAADVTQTVHYMLWQAGLTHWLSDLEIFATLFAAIIHDFLHTGTTNNFHVMSQSDTALTYNDKSVLENYHICQAFSLMKSDECNILANLSKDEYREFRALVIDMVLATDMSSHFQQIKAMKNVLNHSEITTFGADKSKILSLVIHISDISHPAKQWHLHSNWTQLLMEEFFRQGDREKELSLECSPLCDRETTLVAESQLGFIEFIVSPSLDVCGDALDRVHAVNETPPARPNSPAASSLVTNLPRPSSTTAHDDNDADNDISGPQQQQQPQGDELPPPPPTPVAAQLASTAESLTSNIKKIIVSSSATISRKLSSISNASSAEAASELNKQQQQQTASTRSPATDAERDRDKRAAKYQHPVIKPNKLGDSFDSPTTICGGGGGGGSAAQIQRPASSAQLLDADNTRASNAATPSSPTTVRDASSAPPNTASLRPPSALGTSGLLPPPSFKIQRPWIACLEVNKKMWQERATQDAKDREAKVKAAAEASKSTADDDDNNNNTS